MANVSLKGWGEYNYVTVIQNGVEWNSQQEWCTQIACLLWAQSHMKCFVTHQDTSRWEYVLEDVDVKGANSQAKEESDLTGDVTKAGSHKQDTTTEKKAALQRTQSRAAAEHLVGCHLCRHFELRSKAPCG